MLINDKKIKVVDKWIQKIAKSNESRRFPVSATPSGSGTNVNLTKPNYTWTII